MRGALAGGRPRRENARAGRRRLLPPLRSTPRTSDGRRPCSAATTTTAASRCCSWAPSCSSSPRCRGWCGAAPWSALPVLTIAGMAVGALASLYFITREERIWLAPTAVLALVVGVVTWRRPGCPRGAAGPWRRCWSSRSRGHVLVDRRQGARSQRGGVRQRIIGDLAEGEGARAYAEWQRIDLGPVLHWVTINTEQRHAAYRRQSRGGRAGAPPRGLRAPGGWARGAARLSGQVRIPGRLLRLGAAGGDVADGTWRHRRRGAGVPRPPGGRDPCRGCDDGRLPCTRPGIAAMPPLERDRRGRLWPSAHRLTTNLFAFEGAEPGPARTSGSTPERWREMLRPLRGIDATQAEYDQMAEAAAGRQWPVACAHRRLSVGAPGSASSPLFSASRSDSGTRRGRAVPGPNARSSVPSC